MSKFDERERSYEAKFAHDAETNFRIQARRNKLLGLWAAEQMGLQGADAEAYAKQVVAADLQEPGEEDVLRKVLGDLEARQVEISEHRVRRRMAELLNAAREQITSE